MGGVYQLRTNASPVELPATQNTADRQDTDIRNTRIGVLPSVDIRQIIP